MDSTLLWIVGNKLLLFVAGGGLLCTLVQREKLERATHFGCMIAIIKLDLRRVRHVADKTGQQRTVANVSAGLATAPP
jgi:hypothetical protein